MNTSKSHRGSLRLLPSALLFLSLCAAPWSGAPAAVVTNLFVGPGTTNMSSYYSFDGSSGSYLEFSNGYQVTNTWTGGSGFGLIFGGISAGSTNMSGVITGSNTLWYGQGSLGVGWGAGANSSTFLIGSGATVRVNTTVINNSGGAYNNRLVVSGSGTVLSNATGAFYGKQAFGGSLLIREGGTVFEGGGVGIGDGGSTNNLVQVSGGGSRYQYTGGGDLYVGYVGNTLSNRLVVDSGGYLSMASRNLYLGNAGSAASLLVTNGGIARIFQVNVGQNASSTENSVLVSGSGSVLTNQNLYIGYTAAKNNQATVSDGGTCVTLGSTVVGNAISSGTNRLVVTGAGASYRANGDFYLGFVAGAASNQTVVSAGGFLNAAAGIHVGYSGIGATLWVTNGGALYSAATRLGSTAGASNSAMLVSGNNSVVTNVGLYLGFGASRDTQVTVADGARWVNTSSTIFANNAGSGGTNRLVVVGPGTVYAAGNDVLLGYATATAANALVVSNGASWNMTGGNLDVGHVGGSTGSVVVSGVGTTMRLTYPAGVVAVGSNAFSKGAGSFLLSDGAILAPSASYGLIGGLNGSGVISNNGGTFEFAGNDVAVTPNTPGAISVNGGTVSFRGAASAMVLGQITNLSFSGANTLRLDSSTNYALGYYALANGGNFSTLELVNGNPLWNATALYVGSGGTLRASNAMATVMGVLTNAGTVSVVNGRLTYLNNVVLDGGTFSLQNATNQFNQGLTVAAGSSLTVTGGASRMDGAVSNAAGTTIQALNSVVTWGGPVVIGGRYYSDPSTNIFTSNVTVTASGSLYGSNGDLFVFQQDLVMQSTNRSDFSLVHAAVLFTNSATHAFNLTGSASLDVGSNWLSIADLGTNFAIGTLSIASGNKVVVQGGHGTNALYVGWLDIQGIQTNTYAQLTNGIFSALGLPNINIYYDGGVAGNTYLQGQTYNLWGGSLLIPIPEASSLAALGLGLGLLALVRRRAA
jgi:hypothetical protein